MSASINFCKVGLAEFTVVVALRRRPSDGVERVRRTARRTLVGRFMRAGRIDGKRMASTLVQSFSLHGSRVNTQRDNTAILLTPRGKGPNAQGKTSWVEDSGMLSIRGSDGNPPTLHAVHSCQHLGVTAEERDGRLL